MTRYGSARRTNGLAPIAAVGGSLLLLGAVLAVLGKLTLLALRCLLYVALIAVALLVVIGREVAGRWPRRRQPFELVNPVGHCAVDADRVDLGPLAFGRSWSEDFGRSRAQDPPTLVDDLLTPPTRKDPTMPLTTELDLERPIGSGRRLAALTRLMDVRPSLDLDDAVALIDAAAYHVAAGHHDAARRVIGLTAPGTALELVEILAR